jgi:tRNA pseudouridine38-40 synthase
MRIAIGVEYDGSRFCGWQTQPSGCSVQDALERALGEIAGVPVATVCAGRTDAGVHAVGQVVHFDTAAARPPSAWTRGTNSRLPSPVSVTWARVVTEEFHARFSALSRSYRYCLLARRERPGLLQGRVGWWHGSLDVDAMRAAASALLGEHDFSAFRAAECQARSPVRVLTRLDIERDGDVVVLDFRANAFLHHMVRNIVGALVYVGAERKSPAWVGELLASRDRSLGAPTFAPDGLYLTGVEYSPTAGVPPATGPRATSLP